MSLPGPPREHWYLAATSDALGARPLARTILGDPLVLFRAADGAPAALPDRCAHRNLALSRGRCMSGTVECAYHGWRYDGSGACVAIPSLAEGVPGRIGVPARPALERDGFVWVWMGAQAPAGAPRPFPHWREHGWTSFVMVNRFPAGALACLENFLDCPHTAFVHRGWFRSGKARDVPARVENDGGGGEGRVRRASRARQCDLPIAVPAAAAARAHRPLPDAFHQPGRLRLRARLALRDHIAMHAGDGRAHRRLHRRVLPGLPAGPAGAALLRAHVPPHHPAGSRRPRGAQTENVRRFGGPCFTSVASDLVGPQIQRLWREAAGGEAVRAPGAHTEPARERPAAREVVLRF